MKLLERVDIKGNEVPMFVQIHNWLQSKVEIREPDRGDTQQVN